MRRTKTEAAETREAIIDAAEEAFLEQGVSHTSLSDIAQRAGVTRGAIYFHFKDKTDLLRYMIGRIRFPEEELLAEAEKNDSVDPLTILKNSCLACFDHLVNDPHQQRVVTIISKRCEFIGEVAEIGERLQQVRENMLSLFTRMLEVARKRGMLSPNWQLHDGACAIIAVMHGLLMEWINNSNKFNLQQLGEQTISTLIDSMRAPVK